MSDIKFEILYQTKTIIVILNLEDNNTNIFNKFIEQLKKELDINDTNNKVIYKIMTLNTKEMYLIVNEDNFENIIKEKSNDGIIKLFLDIDYEDEIDQLKIKNEMNKGKEIKEDEDFNEDISLSNLIKDNQINKEQENENKNLDKNNINNEIDNHINIINNDQLDFSNFNIINDYKKEKLINTESNVNIINENHLINSNKNVNIIINEPKEEKNNLNKKSINNDTIIKNINSTDHIKQKDFNNQAEMIEICSICNKIIKENIKYECCLCDKIILCLNCEKIHEHPCIKFKRNINFLKSLKDCHFFMSQKQNFNSLLPIKTIKNIFNTTFDIIIELELDNHIEFFPNTIIEIPFKIKNFSDLPVSSDDFLIIVRNYSIVNITYNTKDKFIIGPKNFISKKLLCQSYDKHGRETVSMEIYSNKMKIRESALIEEDIEIIVSSDEENKELNKKFIFYPKIQLLNKLRKKMLLYIIEKHFVDKNVTQIYESLKKNKWDLDASINQLKNI